MGGSFCHTTEMLCLLRGRALAMGRTQITTVLPRHIQTMSMTPDHPRLALSVPWHSRKRSSHQHQRLHFSSKSTIALKGGGIEKEQEELKEEAPKVGRIRTLFNQYGVVFVGTYGSVYLGTLATLYCAYSSGGLTAADVSDLTDGVSALDKVPPTPPTLILRCFIWSRC